jgi:GT2 family glycosyltransferase
MPEIHKRFLVRGAGFDFQEGAEGLFFVHEGGRRIRTDALGRAFWQSLPGDRLAILKRVRSALNVPGRMLEDFLAILIAGGIISLPDKTQKRPAGDAGPLPENEGGLVSVIVVTHSGAGHIRTCLSSIRAQTCRSLEIIVVDNASRDGTADIVASEFPEVRLIRMRKNRHYAGGVNRGAAEARGEFLFIVNDDTETDPACVGILRRRLAGDPRAAAAVPMMRFMDLRPFINGLGNHVRGKGWGSDNFIGAVDLGALDVPDELPSACFGAVLVRHSDFTALKGLDEGYTAYYEDVDWSFRVRLRGRRIVPCPAAVVFHMFGGSGMPGPLKLRLVVRNRLRLVLKLFRKKMRTDYLISYIKEDVKSFLSLARRKSLTEAAAYPRAYASLLRSLPGILRKRAAVMKTRDRRVDDGFLPGPAEGYPILTDDAGNPVIDAQTYFRHYIWECGRTRGKIGAARDIKSAREDRENRDMGI